MDRDVESGGERLAGDGWLRILAVFLRLGLTSFGGPVAHLGYFREALVVRRRWLDEKAFADLVALCQFLPGPASSQVGFALGLHRGGLAGGLAAWLGFTLPSAALMILFAFGLARLGDLGGYGWVGGLKAGAAAVVAHAVWKMAQNLCPDRKRATIALTAALVLVAAPSATTQLAVIVCGGLAGRLLCRARSEPPGAALRSPLSRLAAWWPLGAFLLLLGGLPVAVGVFDSQALRYFDAFFRSGALVFGGGHVVLPLLDSAVGAPGWVGGDAFLAGYGAAQALPGPLFAFSAYLGASVSAPPSGVAGGLLCLAAIYLPSLLLVAGVLPHWQALRARPAVQSALAGANAAVVGLLLAALYDPVFTTGIGGPGAMAVALAAFLLLQVWRRPAWLVVALCGVAGGVAGGL